MAEQRPFKSWVLGSSPSGLAGGRWCLYAWIMTLVLDRDAVRQAVSAYPVVRLRVFGSALTDRFDPDCSDIDLLVDFSDGLDDPFESYFGLKEDLETLFGRPVDLVMTDAIRNPYFLSAVEKQAKEVYAR